MEDIGIGAGIGVVGFWIFIAAMVVAGMWYSIRERDAKHETLRRMVESGAPVDEDLRDQLLGINKRLDRDLKVSGLILAFVGPGLAVLGLFLSYLEDGVLFPLLGVSVLVGLLSVGLLVAAKYAKRSRQEDEAARIDRLGG